jgi:MFS family permease
MSMSPPAAWADFMLHNRRWLGTAFLLFLFSSFGQTFVISLSAVDIRREFGFSHGDFGALFMAITIACALVLPVIGRWVDHVAPRKLCTAVLLLLAAAAALLATSAHWSGLVAALFMLRLLGQGMLTHVAFTLVGRWFAADRGRAIAWTSLGLNLGQAAMPSLFIATAAAAGWRPAWWAIAALLLLALPGVWALTRLERQPEPASAEARRVTAPDRTRAEALRDWAFWPLLLAMAPPALVGNTLFFQQLHLVDIKGWSLEAFAGSFSVMAVLTVLSTIVAGRWVDRVGAVRLMAAYLWPLAAGCLLLSTASGFWCVPVFMALFGVTNGFSLALFGALWPEVYGLKHLGAIRALVASSLVLASALGPGVSGWLIDQGVSLTLQIAFLGTLCGTISLIVWPVTQQVRQRQTATQPVAS